MGKEDIIVVVVLAVLILLSSFFSATETAFSASNKIKLKNMAYNGSKRAKRTLILAERFDKLLITILIGNNIVNILAASLATVLFVKYWVNYGVTLSTIVMTVLVLIFGEIAPKSLAKQIPEKFALFVTPVITFFLWILLPFSFIFGLIQSMMNKLFSFHKEDSITEEELLTFVNEAKEEGGINENESQLIRSVIDFDDMKIEDIFTPRVHVVAIEMNDDLKRITEAFKHSGYSRIPIYDKDIDHVIGIINHKDFYNLVLLEKQPLHTIIKDAVHVTEYMRISDLLTLLKQNKAHMAIVKDEFGGTLGVVTMEDILEEIVGDIWDEHDEIVEHVLKISEDSYKVKGNADLDEFFESIGLEMDSEYVTVNGWVMDALGKIPKSGDEFIEKNLKVTVLQADAKKVLEVLIQVMPKNLEDKDN
ncbi:MAG: HlyC/CorC family transporter [Acholeplasmataceae bacterium]|nr:HlyC/CorC family transporter [Acholeplasmataceae bacterium]